MKRKKLSDLAIFAMFGTIMFISKLIMEFLPNIHPIAMFITVFTLVYRKKALIPIYMYVVLQGLYAGFNVWWIPYLYIWTILWGMVMLIPKNLSYKKLAFFSTLVCALHGILFGTLYAPAQALLFKFSFKMTIAWIVAGLPWDAVHMCGNIVMSTLVVPLYKVLKKMEDKRVSV
jgi:energy-coupling factor transport system substrate-specific component